MKKVSAAETTIFVYDASGVLIAEYSGEIAAEPQVSYLTTDHLGSPRVVTHKRGDGGEPQGFYGVWRRGGVGAACARGFGERLRGRRCDAEGLHGLRERHVECGIRNSECRMRNGRTQSLSLPILTGRTTTRRTGASRASIR